MQTSKTWSVERSLKPVFMGGRVWASQDGKTLATTCGETVQVLDAETSKVEVEIKGDGEVISAFAMKDDGSQMVTCSRSYRIRQWDVPSGKERRDWVVSMNSSPRIIHGVCHMTRLSATIDGVCTPFNFNSSRSLVSFQTYALILKPLSPSFATHPISMKTIFAHML